jgi:hypothetical protein
MGSSRSFRHRFLPAYAAILGCTLPIAGLAAELDFGITAHPWKAAVLLVFTATLAATLTPVWTTMRVTVSPEGLNCYTLAGTYQFARWEAVTWVRPTRWMLGLPYLRLGLEEGGSPVWLPMFLVDMPRFAALVLSYAGSSHPVAVVLSKGIGAQQRHAADDATRRR